MSLRGLRGVASVTSHNDSPPDLASSPPSRDDSSRVAPTGAFGYETLRTNLIF